MRKLWKNWSVHNLIGHPASEIVYLVLRLPLGRDRAQCAASRVHDFTVPSSPRYAQDIGGPSDAGFRPRQQEVVSAVRQHLQHGYQAVAAGFEKLFGRAPHQDLYHVPLDRPFHMQTRDNPEARTFDLSSAEEEFQMECRRSKTTVYVFRNTNPAATGIDSKFAVVINSEGLGEMILAEDRETILLELSVLVYQLFAAGNWFSAAEKLSTWYVKNLVTAEDYTKAVDTFWDEEKEPSKPEAGRLRVGGWNGAGSFSN